MDINLNVRFSVDSELEKFILVTTEAFYKLKEMEAIELEVEHNTSKPVAPTKKAPTKTKRTEPKSGLSEPAGDESKVGLTAEAPKEAEAPKPEAPEVTEDEIAAARTAIAAWLPKDRDARRPKLQEWLTARGLARVGDIKTKEDLEALKALVTDDTDKAGEEHA